MEASELEARSIGYASALDRATQSVFIPTAVYTSLIATVRASLPRTLHKYTALRRRLLAAQAPAAAGQFELRQWDVRGGGLGALGTGAEATLVCRDGGQGAGRAVWDGLPEARCADVPT